MQIKRFVIGLMLMAAAVSLQMYLIKYNQNFKNLMLELTKKLPDNIQGLSFDFSEYVDNANNYLKSVLNDYYYATDPLPDDDVPPEEVIIKDEVIRNFRPPHLEFRVGDVILTQNMVVGAIIGWSIDMADLSKEPEYMLLTDNFEQLIKENQDKMIPIESYKINHKKISQYFVHFDGIRYIPKQWLAKLYPKD